MTDIVITSGAGFVEFEYNDQSASFANAIADVYTLSAIYLRLKTDRVTVTIGATSFDLDITGVKIGRAHV